MISGNFLENIFKVKTSFFVIFIILVTTITSFEVSKNFDWVQPLDLNSEFNKKNNQILSLVFLFAFLKVIVRLWDFLVSISNYGKLYKKISRANIGNTLTQIGIRKLIIEFIDFKYQGEITLIVPKSTAGLHKIVINITAGNSTRLREHDIYDRDLVELFTKYANKTNNGDRYSIVYNRTNGSNDISSDFMAGIYKLRTSLENESEILSLLMDSKITKLI
ncbi:MAG: hypothetical protein ACI9TO_000936 [Rickettsiales bacterium]|jgi:hypothetical protein